MSSINPFFQMYKDSNANYVPVRERFGGLRIIGLGFSLVIGGISLATAFNAILPTPIVYGKLTILQSTREDIKDPKFEIRFGNGGHGPMYVDSIYWRLNGQKLPGELQNELKGKYPDIQISPESIIGERNGKAYTNGYKSIIPLFTARPNDDLTLEKIKGKEWADPLVNNLQEGKLELEVKYRNFNWRRYPKTTAIIPVFGAPLKSPSSLSSSQGLPVENSK